MIHIRRVLISSNSLSYSRTTLSLVTQLRCVLESDSQTARSQVSPPPSWCLWRTHAIFIFQEISQKLSDLLRIQLQTGPWNFLSTHLITTHLHPSPTSVLGVQPLRARLNTPCQTNITRPILTLESPSYGKHGQNSGDRNTLRAAWRTTVDEVEDHSPMPPIYLLTSDRPGIRNIHGPSWR